MPGHAGSPYWASVDFESDGEEDQSSPPNHRIYLDPWDNEAYGMIEPPSIEPSSQENFNSFAGEPVSASFYYVPTKSYDSEEDIPKMMHIEDVVVPEYGRRASRVRPEFPPEMPIYGCAGERVIRDRRRSLYIEEPAAYAPRPLLYEHMYGPLTPPPPPGYLPPAPRARMSLQHHPEYVAAAAMGYSQQRRHSRLPDAYEHLSYEAMAPEYEDWRPFPKAAPDNFHLSRYGHLQIDYSCSWNSLDRLIRNQ